MSFAVVGVPVAECLCLLACGRYIYKRCCHAGYQDSEDWDHATSNEFEPVPRICRVLLAVYEEDLSNPRWPPAGGYRMDLNCVVKRTSYAENQGYAPPYLIYLDHNEKDIVFAIRGLNLINEQDYAVLLNNKLGKETFDGGFVHYGLMKSAKWLLNREAELLSRLVSEHPSYTLTFAGHSLGSGIAAMLTMLVAKDPNIIGGIPRERIRCYAVAPARCMSLNLAVRYADIIHSIILQDDFLPRTATPLEDIFKCIFCLPCLLCSRCTKDMCLSEEKMLQDPRRLYTPGRVYHIIERKFWGCKRYPPDVRTAVPVEGRFEHVVLSCNATKDHSLVWIEREASKALELMEERMKTTEVPSEQKMSRQQTLKEEHKAALERAESLNVPNTKSHDNVSAKLETQQEEEVNCTEEHKAVLEKAQLLNLPNTRSHDNESLSKEANCTEEPSHGMHS